MKRILVFGLLMLTLSASAQINQRNKRSNAGGKNSAAGLPLSERIYFGGGGSFGGGYSADGFRYTYFAASPIVGYRITIPFSAGLGFNFASYRFPDLGLSLAQYGLSPFVRYQFGRLFAYGEYSVISVPFRNTNARAIRSRLPIGLGYTLPIGSKAALNAMALYDVLYTKNNGYFYSPWVLRVFFSAGAVSF
jgi:hypothetical protein